MRLLKLAAVLGMFHCAFALAAGPAPRPADARGADRLHGVESKALTPDKRPPAADLDRQGQPTRAPSSASAVAAICSTAEFESLSGSALVSKVKSCDVSSLNDLYGLSGTSAYYVFQESKMASVAYGLRDVSASYPGNNSTQALQLVTFLRAGYYVQYYNSASVGQYGATLKTAIRSALDAFFGNANSLAANDANRSEEHTSELQSPI